MKIQFNQPENKNPHDDHGLRVHYSEAKRPGKQWRWYLILLISSLPLIYLIGLLIWDMVGIHINGRVRVTNFVVRAPVDGYVNEVFVAPQQIVESGAKLAQMTNTALQDNFDRLRLEIDTLEKEKNKMATQGSPLQQTTSQLIQFALEQRQFAHDRMRQYEVLFKEQAATQAEVATARSQYKATMEHLVSLRRGQSQELERSISQSQLASVEVRRISNQINQIQLETDKIGDQLQQLNLMAPEKGGLVTEIFIQPGEFLSRGQALLELILLNEAHIDAFIPPKYQDYAVVGQLVQVEFPNGEKANGKIFSVPGVMQKSPSEETTPLEIVRSAILAKIALTSSVKSRLMNGMPVEISFD